MSVQNQKRLLTLACVAIYILLFWACLYRCTSAKGQAPVSIPKEHRVANVNNLRCAWAALETVARHQGVTSLYGLTEEQEGVAGPERIAFLLQSRSIPFGQQAWGNKSFTLLDKAQKESRPAVVGLRYWESPLVHHAVVYCGRKNGKVYTIENSGPDALKTLEWDEETFIRYWDGWALVITGKP